MEILEKATSKLAQARIERGLTQTDVAEYTGVDVGTVSRWERGICHPNPRHAIKLCTLFGKSAQELGLTSSEAEEAEERDETPSSPIPIVRPKESNHTFAKYFQRDLELRIQCIMYDWLHCKPSDHLAMLQHQLSRELEDYAAMTNEQPRQNAENADISRRATLRRLALLPIYALGLDAALGTAPKWAPEDLLTHCAAGMTACEQLAKGQYDDMVLAYQVLSTYLTPLKEEVAQSSLYRQEAARLAAQALLIKATLSTHREGPERAIGYAKQAVIYSKESADLALQLVILRRLAWIYFCDKQLARAAETALQAQDLLEHAQVPLSPRVHSAVYAGVAKYQASNGHEEDASLAFHRANDTFPDQSSNGGDPGIISFDRSGLFNDGGLTYYYLEQYDEAFNLLAQVVDPETLTSKMPVASERNRVQVINHQALVSLKRQQKDMDLSIQLWTAGIQGAKALHSKQRYNEALEAFGIMQALWPGDRRIKELRDLTRHW